MCYLEISERYMKNEPYVRLSTGENVYEWVKNYLKRNKIDSLEKSFYGENYLVIYFNTEHQKNCFVRIGNSIFPYFEFQ